jgi:hypothetical protein
MYTEEDISFGFRTITAAYSILPNVFIPSSECSDNAKQSEYPD